MSTPKAGRPRVSSLETLTEAACELFLEQGFESTSIADIARRAGVSRASFFNYASSKAGLLWAGFDARLVSLETALGHLRPADAAHEALADLAPDGLALAMVNAEAMGIRAELEREAAIRLARIAAAISRAEQHRGRAPMPADVVGAAYAGAVMTALRHWAVAGPGKQPLGHFLHEACGAVVQLAEQ